MKTESLNTLKAEVSDTLCLAKFHEATIWLYSGKIASCHHTPLVPLGTTPITFFNPTEKRIQQSKMVAGQRPTECGYCWNLEDKNVVSDRYKKSISFKSSLTAKDYLDPTYNFKPKALEISFQRLCNLACSYCSSDYSTLWSDDIVKNGNYTAITTDKRLHYQRGVTQDTPVDMNLFWSWFNDVANGIESIRVTGGEPLLHEETFMMLNTMQAINPDVEFVVHTNLCQKPTIIERFVDKISAFKTVRINISNESAGDVAEFIRDGMNYALWLDNLRVLSGSNANLSVSTSITALSLTQLDQMYKDIIALRKTTHQKPYIAINFVTYPEFQSIACLTQAELLKYYQHYSEFFASIADDLLEIEHSHVERLLTMLRDSTEHADQPALRRDYYSFFEQYSRRRNKINLSNRIDL
jgi:organic radical activating enzyme